MRTHQRNLLDILSQTTFLADRSLALRTTVQIDPDLFIDVLGLGSVASGVACFAPGPRWVSAALDQPMICIAARLGTPSSNKTVAAV